MREIRFVECRHYSRSARSQILIVYSRVLQSRTDDSRVVGNRLPIQPGYLLGGGAQIADDSSSV